MLSPGNRSEQNDRHSPGQFLTNSPVENISDHKDLGRLRPHLESLFQKLEISPPAHELKLRNRAHALSVAALSRGLF